VTGGLCDERWGRHEPQRWGRDERGQVGGIEAVAFGLLVLVIGVLMVSNAWGVVDAKTAARTASREGARPYATAPTSDPREAGDLADQAAHATLVELGWARPDVALRAEVNGFERCAVVTYVVSVPVPALRLPGLHFAPGAFHATAHHTERVDPYRSGVPAGTSDGAANCSGSEEAP